MSRAEIICERRGSAGVVTLDRPSALNALTLNMVRLMTAALVSWEADAHVTRVVITAAGDKAFCAGGDIRLLWEQGQAGDHPAQLAFWSEEYVLNTRLKRYPKPTVALVDGIVMGGGVGVSVHTRHRVAGDRWLFAMPETSIGLFPDVGATYFLPRLPGRVNRLLALTGQRVATGDAVALGIANAYVPSEKFGDLTQTLCGDGDVAETIAAFAAAPPAGALTDTAWIEHCFAPDTLIGIRDRLASAARSGDKNATVALEKMLQNSPTSMAIALRQMQIGGTLGFEDAMRAEYRVVSRVSRGHDFYEGVRARIIDKDNTPHWRPDKLEDLRSTDVDQYFDSLGGDELDPMRGAPVAVAP